PPYDGYEYCSNTFIPQCTVEDLTTQDRYITVKSTVTDLSTGWQLYSRTDSVYVFWSTPGQFTASPYQGFPCGRYRLTMTASVKSLGTDGWTYDNTMTRDFSYMKTLTPPFFDNFAQVVNQTSKTLTTVLDPCNW